MNILISWGRAWLGGFGSRPFAVLLALAAVMLVALGNTNFADGISSRGVPVEGLGGGGGLATVREGLGTTYYVDPSNGSSSQSGKQPSKAFDSMTTAFSALTHYDTVILMPGNHTGNHTTPIDATAAFCQVLGMVASRNFYAAWAGATVSSSPIINVRARGWRFAGIEFDCPSSSAAIHLTRSVASGHRPDGAEFDTCLFTGGKFGIDQQGGSTYVHIVNCQFDLMSVSGGSAISASDTGHQLPGVWHIEHNTFHENVNHIDMGVVVANHGFNSSKIGPENTFQLKGNARDVTVALDIRGGGGNEVYKNGIGGAKSTSTGGTTFEIGSDDRAYGNVFNDGVQTAEFAQS